jgi:CrcB protein
VTILLVALGAAVGAPLRYLASVFPWGTFTVNVAGCALLGFLAALPAGSGTMALAGTGFCGALTTYSTFGYETLRLAEDRARTLALINVAASVAAGLGAAYCGMVLAEAVTGT